MVEPSQSGAAEEAVFGSLTRSQFHLMSSAVTSPKPPWIFDALAQMEEEGLRAVLYLPRFDDIGVDRRAERRVIGVAHRVVVEGFLWRVIHLRGRARRVELIDLARDADAVNLRAARLPGGNGLDRRRARRGYRAAARADGGRRCSGGRRRDGGVVAAVGAVVTPTCRAQSALGSAGGSRCRRALPSWRWARLCCRHKLRAPPPPHSRRKQQEAPSTEMLRAFAGCCPVCPCPLSSQRSFIAPRH